MPSVDVLFSSMAENVIDGMGVILTGMGMDGAKGMLKMRQKGMYTIGQSRESCVVYGMPMEARKLGATQERSRGLRHQTPDPFFAAQMRGSTRKTQPCKTRLASGSKACSPCGSLRAKPSE